MTDRYHHGDLPNALRSAAAEVIDEKGLGGFSLREVARRAGVSHAAPAHHFGDTTGLLTSLATEGFRHLHAATSAAAETEEDPGKRLVAIGRAYVSVGVNHPAHCQVLFRRDLIDTDNQEYAVAGIAAYAVLEQTLRDLAADINPALDIDRAAKLCWSAMQGLVVLHETISGGQLQDGAKADDLDSLVTSFTELMIEGFRAR